MEFSVFLNQLSFNDIITFSSKKILIEYKNRCTIENDFIQLYELKNILEVVNIFRNLFNAYLNCNKKSKIKIIVRFELRRRL